MRCLLSICLCLVFWWRRLDTQLIGVIVVCLVRFIWLGLVWSWRFDYPKDLLLLFDLNSLVMNHNGLPGFCLIVKMYPLLMCWPLIIEDWPNYVSSGAYYMICINNLIIFFEAVTNKSTAVRHQFWYSLMRATCLFFLFPVWSFWKCLTTMTDYKLSHRYAKHFVS